MPAACKITNLLIINIFCVTEVCKIKWKETIKKLLEIDPQAKSIVSSGYSNDPIMSNYKKFGFKGVVSKPYRIEELSWIIRDVLKSGN